MVDLYSPGDFLGYVALLEGKVYSDNAAAMEDTELAIIPKEDFDELLSTNMEVTKKFIQLMAKNISEKENQLLSLTYNSLRKKVAESLMLLQKKYQQKQEDKFIIDISRDNLASIAGTAKESLIRTLSEFRAEKLIDIGKDGSVIILNQNKLEQLQN